MQNYFEEEITRIEKELRWLKTSVVKSGAAVTSAVKSVPFDIPLELVSSTNANGSVAFRVTTEETAIFTTTLDKYYDDITIGPMGDTRRRNIEAYCVGEGVYSIRVLAFGNSEDIATLEVGGSVTISGTLTVTCTDQFTLEVA